MVIEIKWKNLFIDWLYDCKDYKITKEKAICYWEDGVQEFDINEISEITVRTED